MDSESPTILTRFWVVGDELNPDVFTRLVGLQPTGSGRKGDPSANPTARKLGRTVPKTFWEIEVERNSYNTDEGIQEVLGLIWPRRETIVEFLNARPSMKAGFLLVVHIHHDPPAYEVNRDSIQKLASLGCEFAMDDIYRSYEDEDENDSERGMGAQHEP